MKVARLYGVGDIRIADEDPPIPGAGESLIRVTAVGLCGSDLHWFAEGGIGDAQLVHSLASIFHRAVSGRCDGLRITVWD